ncbi:MAG: hypothetical protein A2046_03485 [Bacteroidetes bacterium GWA2_30_7]|nr:MAG: hypothetical protein A2046_03485 [Bacteroidetes bacterium GWA2_30_7]
MTTKVIIFLLVLLSINSFSQTKPTLYPKLESGKYGYYNTSKTLVITHQFDNALGFNQGLAAVKKTDKWGYINETGGLVIDYLYDNAWFFTEGLAPVCKAKKWGYIDKDGKTVIDFKYDDAGDFSDGIAWVKTVGKVSFIDKLGKSAISTEYLSATSFSEGLAGVNKDKLWGYIDKTGTTKIKHQYDNAMPFEDGLAAVKQGSYWGFIDINAKKMVDFTLSSVSEDYKNSAFAWSYASNAYSSLSDDNSFYSAHLKKAVELIRLKGSYFSESELELLVKYYEALGDNDGASWAKKEMKAKKKSNRSPSASIDLSIATAPVKLGFYKFLRQVPLYAELRLGLIGTALRLNTYNEYTDNYRFGKWKDSNKQDTIIYSGRDLSVFFLIYMDKYIEKANIGRGYVGPCFGFEYRNSNYNVKPVAVDVLQSNGYNYQSLILSPQYKVQEVSFVFNYTVSSSFLYFSMGYSIGVGHKTYSGIDYSNYNFTGTAFDKANLTSWSLPLRIQCRLGINIL